MLNNVRDVLTPTEAKEILRIGTNRIYELLSSGELKSIRCGCKYLIPKIFLEEYLLRGYNDVGGDIPRPKALDNYCTDNGAVAS